MNRYYKKQNAFTLVEMAMVLLIIGVLTKSAISPLSAMREHRLHQQAEQQVQTVREAVFAYLVAYGSLPCPLSESANFLVSSNAGNLEDLSGTRCDVASGFVPTHLLALAGATNEQGALLDPWGRSLRYAVSLSNSTEAGDQALPDWTTPGEAAHVGISNLSSSLVICNSAATANCTGRAIRASQIAFVVLSTGADSSAQGYQGENLDGDDYFVSSGLSIAQDTYYDDLLVWGSNADVIFWLLRMGWLP